VGKGWKNITTKDINGWRDREQIKRECMEFVSSRGLLDKIEKKNGERIRYLGIGDIQKSLYLGSDISNNLKRGWRNAIRTNNKKKVYLLAESISQAFVGTTEPVSWCNEQIAEEVGRFFREYPEISDIIINKYGSGFLTNFLKIVKV
jgi:hypothetical protein